MATALILSGGGAKGAFSVGALTYMTRTRNDISFDIISGTSTGALIAGLIIIDRIDILRDIYSTVTNDNIIRQLDAAASLRNNQPYLLSDGPLVTIINQKITDVIAQQIINSPKLLLLTAVNLQTGRITVFSNQNIPPTDNYDVIVITNRDTLIKAFRASSNQAAFLPPVPITASNGTEYQFIDGGCREVIPCLAVMDQHPDQIYVLSNNPQYIFSVNATYTSVLKVLMRVIGILIQDVRENDLAALEHWRQTSAPATNIVYIEPDNDLDPDYPTGLRFEPGRMQVMMARGARRAQDILEAPASAPRILARTVTEDTQCRALTLQGNRCRNTVIEGTEYCHVHS